MLFLKSTRRLRSPSWKCLSFCSAVMSSIAGVSAAQTIADYTALPPTVSDATKPLVMLVMSRDNQLWHKAYNDYSDLDPPTATPTPAPGQTPAPAVPAQLETTYKDTIEYFGYFNSGFCYSYASSVFEPTSAASNPNGTPKSHACSGAWSGNFLNWLTTTRIDVVRKVLYGGYRSTDTDDETILQRAYIPADNHAFVKIVDDPTTIANFTPITGQTSLSFCNVTDYVSGASDISRDLSLVTNPPKLKVAIGNQLTWASSERQQCQYVDEGGNAGFSATRPAPGAIANIPSDSELVVRVRACVEGFDQSDDSSCRRYVSDSGDESYKPYGFLQSEGESGRFKFGLMTGTYVNKDNGGALRKNISFFGGPDVEEKDREINPQTGQFETTYVAENGATTEITGIIRTINALRIQAWDYGDTHYDDCDTFGISQNIFLTGTDPEEQCRDWGNPLSEMYLEALRYFVNKGDATTTGGSQVAPTAAYASLGDAALLPGLNSPAWEAPITQEEPCSKCSIIVLSTGLNNFDSDNLGNLNVLPGIASQAQLETAWVDTVGTLEGLGLGEYIVGVSPLGGGTEGECDAKRISSLSDVSGPCPEVPTLKGSYTIAGAAYYAHQTDLREDLEGTQNVETFTVALAESLPSFELESESGAKITMSPACLANTDGSAVPTTNPSSPQPGWTACSLVDLIVLETRSNYQRYLIAWEDSQWGNDYDMDSHAVIEICSATGSAADVLAQCGNYTSNVFSDFGVPGRGNGYDYTVHADIPQWGAATDREIQIRTSLVGYAGGNAMQLGFTISGAAGVGDNGSYVSQILNYGNNSFNSVQESVVGGVGGEDDRIIWSAEVEKFTGSTTSNVRRLQNPLWYAAKWGNIEPLEPGRTTPTGVPLQRRQWDKQDILGNNVEDGIPDAYFPVRNPSNLRAALTNIFDGIGNRVSSGSSAAVNAQTGSGEGALYQALYTPSLKQDRVAGAENLNTEVSWFGSLNALFIDDQGRIREDRVDISAGSSDRKGLLTPYDRVLEISVDVAGEEATVKAFTVNADGSTGAQDGAAFPLTSDEYNTIWSALDGLDALTNFSSQRTTYESSSASGRYIFTGFDRNGDGSVIEPEYNDINTGRPGSEAGATDRTHAFIASNFAPSSSVTANDSRYLALDGTPTDQNVADLVNFVRGEEGLPDSRSRTLGDNKYLLGDIVHSTPVGVGRPNDRYDLLYRDDSYREFFDQYQNRRNVVYVGANDGMLHAFNGGFFVNNPQANVIGFNVSDGNPGTVEHPLGSELWAYVPFNALPHLKWLKQPNYRHVYYVDGPVQSFDVNIFAGEDESIYPNGWGTIIVASMRFGGGEYNLDHDGDPDTDNVTLSSSYIVMDVTNPEAPPKLIAEISDAELGYSISRPTLIKRRVPDSSGSYTGSGAENSWQLVFGSGPKGTDGDTRVSALQSAVSASNAEIFTFDLIAKTLTRHSVTAADEFAFVGGIESVDWNLDYTDDAFYFGTVSGTPEAPEGSLQRAVLADTNALTPSFSDFLTNVNLAFSATPSVRRNNDEFWVHVGSGRFYVQEDNQLNQQQMLFGIKEPVPAASNFPDLSQSVSSSDLVDTTGIDVFEDGTIVGSGGAAVILSSGAAGSQSADTFDDALRFVGDSAGWKFNFRDPGVVGEGIADTTDRRNTDNPRIRTNTKVAYGGTTLVNTAYEGTGEFCSSEGDAILLTPHLAVGLPAPFAAVGVDPNDPSPNSPEDNRVLQGINLGGGLPSDPLVVPSSGGGFKILTQKGDAELTNTQLKGNPLPPGRTGWREIPIDQ